jgi:hypothetical protein
MYITSVDYFYIKLKEIHKAFIPLVIIFLLLHSYKFNYFQILHQQF